MKKIGFVLILCCFFGVKAQAKDVYYKQINDDASGRTIEYFDLGGEDTERCYFTQNYWLKDGSGFVVGSRAEYKLYKYDLQNHTAEPLFGGRSAGCIDVSITDGDVMYFRSKDSKLYREDLKSNEYRGVYAEVNADGTALNGTILLDSPEINATTSYDKNVCFSGKTGRADQNGKHYLFNQEFTEYGSGQGWKQWKNGFYFNIPDDFVYGSNYETIHIKVEYYAPSGNIELLMKNASGADTSVGKVAVTSNKWAEEVFDVSADDGKNIVFSNSLSGCDFRINFECQSYVHKVTVYEDNIKCLGTRPWSSYLVHSTRDGSVLSWTGSGNDLIFYDVENNAWERKVKQFPSSNPTADHNMINPVYPNLALFAHEGSASDIFDRMWVFDRNTGKFTNVFKQYANIKNETTGEAIGHENWSADGESIIAVKYVESNIGREGIIRVNKYGGEREYINGDYQYWHCHPSPDGRFVVADCKMVKGKSKIVVIDTKTGRSYVVADQKVGANDPWQPHAQFSSDGKKVTFTMIGRQLNGNDVLGVGIVDVSDIVNDSQIAEPVFEDTNEQKGFRISPFEVGFDRRTGQNEVRVRVENFDGYEKDICLYAAVYADDGRLISVSKDKYTSSADATLTAPFEYTQESKTLKCFLWNGEFAPLTADPTTVEKLRAAKTGMDSVVLSWQPGHNVKEGSYEIYKNGAKIAETSDLIYRDTSVSRNTEYTYQVKPKYTNGYISDDGSCVTVDLDGISPGSDTYAMPADGNNIPDFIPAGTNNITGPVAGVKIKTRSDTVTSNIGTLVESGLKFLLNDSGTTMDSYTEAATKSSRLCRKNTEQTVDGQKKIGMFYFKVDKDLISQDARSVDITVTYYNYNSSSTDLYLDYNASDGSSGKSVKIDTLKSGWLPSGSWTTKTVSVTDAKFVASAELTNCDFRIRPTRGGVYISEVSVKNKSAAVPCPYQYVEWDISSQNGLALLGGGTLNNGARYIGSGEWLTFNVDDTYMYGSNKDMAWIDITYLDSGTADIYLEYNTSDPTAASGQKPHKRAEDVIKCTDTGKLLTKRIAVIDADFSGYGGYDLRIGTNSGAYINKVKVLGY